MLSAYLASSEKMDHWERHEQADARCVGSASVATDLVSGLWSLVSGNQNGAVTCCVPKLQCGWWIPSHHNTTLFSETVRTEINRPGTGNEGASAGCTGLGQLAGVLSKEQRAINSILGVTLSVRGQSPFDWTPKCPPSWTSVESLAGPTHPPQAAPPHRGTDKD